MAGTILRTYLRMFLERFMNNEVEKIPYQYHTFQKDKIDNDIKLFSEKESLFKSYREVENMIVNLNSEYMKHFQSMVLENKNLRHEIHKIDSNYCHQLTKVRLDSNRVNTLLTTQIQRADNERDKLVKTHLQILTKEQIQNKKLQDQIANLIVNNRELSDKLDYLTTVSNPTLNKNNLELKLETYDLSVARSHLVQMENDLIEKHNSYIKLNDKIIMDLNETKVGVMDTLNYLEDLSKFDYLPIVDKNGLELLKPENKDLTNKSCKCVQMVNNLKEEQRKNIELENEIKCLKNEIIVLVKQSTKEHIHFKKCNDRIVSLKQENAEIKSVLQKYKGRLSPVTKTDTMLKLKNDGKGDAKANKLNKTMKIVDQIVNSMDSILDKNESNNHLIEIDVTSLTKNNLELKSENKNLLQKYAGLENTLKDEQVKTFNLQKEITGLKRKHFPNKIENMLLENQKKGIQSNEKTIILNEIIFQVNEMLNQLESYLPDVVKRVTELKSKNMDLSVENCKNVHAKYVLKEEQRKNIKLEKDILCLKGEIVKAKEGLKEQTTCKKLNEKIISLQQENAELKFVMQKLKTRLPPEKKTNAEHKLGGGGKGCKGVQSLLPPSKMLNLKQVPLQKDSKPKLGNGCKDDIEAKSIANTIEVSDQMTNLITEKNELSNKLNQLTLENESLTTKSHNIDLLENKLKEAEAKNIILQNEIASLTGEQIQTTNHSLIMKPNQSVQIDKNLVEEISNIPKDVSISLHIEPQSASAAVRDIIKNRYFIQPIPNANGTGETIFQFVREM